MVGPQLRLPRCVKHQIASVSVIDLLQQPIEIRLQILYRIEDRPVRPEAVLRHDLIEADEARDVDGALIWGTRNRRVEVDETYRTVQGTKELGCPFRQSGGGGGGLTCWRPEA